MFQVSIEDEYIENLLREEIQKHLDKLEGQQTFWNTDDLKKHTRMSWNTIQATFFHDPGFPKAKVGGKWLYPAKETELFLLEWLSRQ